MSGSHCATSRMRCAADTAEPRRDAPRMMGAATSNMPMTASSRPASKGPDRPPPSCSPSPNHNTPSTAAGCLQEPEPARRGAGLGLARLRVLPAQALEMRAGLRLRMQGHHVGVAVHRVQHRRARPAALSCAAAPGARGALQAQGASTQATSSANANTSAAAGIQ